MALLDDILKTKELQPEPTVAKRPEPQADTTAAATEAIRPLEVQPIAAQPAESAQQVNRTQIYNPDANFYQNAFQALNKSNAPETEAEMKAREKKEKARSTIFALADGLSHIANIWGATRGAAPMQISSLSDANRQRYEYADEIRRRNTDRYNAGTLNAMGMDRQEATRRAQEKYRMDIDQRNWDRTIERDKVSDDRWQQSTEATQAYREQQQRLAQDKFKYDKEQNERNYKLNVQKLNAQIAKNGDNGGDKYYSDPKNFTIIPGTGGNPIAIPRNVGEGFYNKYAQKIKALNDKDTNKEKKDLRMSLMNSYFDSPNTNANQAIVESFLQDFPELENELSNEVNQFMNYQTGSNKKTTPTIQPKSATSPGSATNATVPVNPKAFESWGNYEIK